MNIIPELSSSDNHIISKREKENKDTISDITKQIDIVFECQFALAMIQDGYDSLNDDIIDLIRHILNSSEYKYDSRIKTLKKDFEKTIKIWGYGNDIDSEEILDLYNKIQNYTNYNSNKDNKSDYIYIKTLQRALRIKKIVESMSLITYQKYKKYHSYFDHINKWTNSIL